jgi:hypothetical protein
MPVEPRPYGPESSPEEIDALRARIEVTPSGVLVFNEVPVPTVFSVTVLWDRFEELIAGRSTVSYVADLTGVQRPTAEVRAALKQRATRLKDRYGHVALVVGDNVVIRAMARLFAYSMGLRSVSLHPSRDQAIDEVRRDLAR